MADVIPLRWQAHEYDHYERSTDWYWAVAIITLSIIALSIIWNDYLFALVIAIGVFALVLYTKRPSKLITYELSKKGIRIEKTLYPYPTLESFWVEDYNQTPRPKLILKSIKVMMPHIVIPIEGIHPDEVHSFLSARLPEEEHVESLSVKVMEYLGF